MHVTGGARSSRVNLASQAPRCADPEEATSIDPCLIPFPPHGLMDHPVDGPPQPQSSSASSRAASATVVAA